MTATEAPLWDEPQFAALAEGLVANFAPRLFALVKEEGERVDGRTFAWGLEFEDHAEVVSTPRWSGSAGRTIAASPQRKVPGEKLSRHGKMRLIWYNPDAATPQRQGSLTHLDHTGGSRS